MTQPSHTTSLQPRKFYAWVALVLTLATLPLTSCTKKRAPIFSQGQGTELEEIQNWKNLRSPLITYDELGQPDTTNAQDSFSVSDKVKGVNFLPLVKYSATQEKLAQLIGKTPFRGKPNTQGTYEVRVKLTDKDLRILKVAKPEDLPHDELFYVEEKYEDGRVGIPFVGYPIKSFYKVEFQKTSDDQDSHHLIEVPTAHPSQATHLKIDWSSKEVFEVVKDKDLLPASLFFSINSETHKIEKAYTWYFAETVIAKSVKDESTIVGENPNISDNSGLASATKVLFVPREKNLRVINVARDERLTKEYLATSADLDSDAALNIPVEWVSRRIKNQDSTPAFQGESVTERKWNERGYITLDLTHLESAATTSTQKGLNASTRLLDIELDENYFGFTIMVMSGGMGKKVHYSFLRADNGRKPYTPKKSFDEDQKRFGFFTSEKPFIWNWEYYTKNDAKKRVFVSRYNPNSDVITFHLSYSSPKWLEDIAEKSVEAWNQAFEEALKDSPQKIKIEFSKQRVQLGDLRYNIIHIVDTLNEDGLLGFGPSIADPETGEIISATSNVYANSIRSIAASTIRQYIVNRLEGRLNPEEAIRVALIPSEKQMESSAKYLSHKHELEAKLSLRQEQLNLQNTLSTNSFEQKINELEKGAQAEASKGCQYSQQIALSSNDRDIINYCPEVEKSIVAYTSFNFEDGQNIEATWDKVWESAKPALESCSAKITRGKLLSTLIHEMGHNFGLRHNFLASTDKENFIKSKTIFGEEVLAQTSSIMEYTDWDHDRLTRTGPYDIAALQYGYANQVALKGNSLMTLDNEHSMEFLLNQQGKNLSDLKPYKFCTDETAYLGLDVLCKQHDAGTNPSEIAKFYMDGFKQFESFRKLRRVQPHLISELNYANYAYARYFIPLREIYDQWRYQLAEYVHKSNKYLDNYNLKTYQAALDEMRTDPVYGKIYQDYYATSQEIYKFFKSIVFAHNQYCTFETDQGLKVAEFSNVQSQLADTTHSSIYVRTCRQATQTYSSELAKILGVRELKLLQEEGSPYLSLKNTKPESLEDHLVKDVVGNRYVRLAANLAIHDRQENAKNYLNRFLPNMTDEPTLYQDFTSAMFNRILNGIDFDSALGSNSSKIGILPFFSTENQLVVDIATRFGNGLATPNENSDGLNSKATGQKLAPFTTYTPHQSEDPKKFPEALMINGRFVFASVGPKEQYPLANLAIEKYKQNQELLSMSPVDAEQVLKTAKLLIDKVPHQTEEMNKVTLLDYVRFAISALQFDDHANGIHSCASEGSPLFEQMMQIISALNPYIEKAGGLQEFLKSPIVQMPMLDFIKQLDIDPLLFEQKQLGNYLKSIQVCTQQYKSSFQTSTQFKRDLEAQMSSLLKILKFYAE